MVMAMLNILIVGATGFIGKRLVHHLFEKGHQVYICGHLNAKKLAQQPPLLIYIDCNNARTLKNCMQHIDVIYFIVHSLSEKNATLDIDEKIISLFLQNTQETSIKQIIFLVDMNDAYSHAVDKTLQQLKIPTTTLRVSMIIGSESASFEIMQKMCDTMPILITPRWVHTLFQPIAIDDLLFYLSAVLVNKACYDNEFDLGGPEIITFKQLMIRYMEFKKLKKRVIDLNFNIPWLSKCMLTWFTSTRFSTCAYLIDSMTKSGAIRLNKINEIIPHECMSCDAAIAAIQRLSL